MVRKNQSIFTSFLDRLGVKHTQTFSDKYFREHPHKYDLFGLSCMLSDYGIETIALRIKNKEEDLANLEAPFIAHATGDFVLVDQIRDNRVKYEWRGKEVEVKREEFIHSWSGVVLLAEPGEVSIEPNYEENHKQEQINEAQKVFLSAVVALLVGTLFITQKIYTQWGITLSLLINLFGAYISYLLVLKQLHVQSNYADKICSLFKQSDCNNILESDAAKLFGIFSWSEIGLGYFISNTLLLLFAPQLITYYAIINLCALPYTIWSVWYQKFKAKQWCPLCLTVQLTLWMIFSVNLFAGYLLFPELSLSAIFLTGCLYLIPFLAIRLIIPKFSEANRVGQITQEINSIKANEEIFTALLQKQQHYEVSRETSAIFLGNPEAKLLITVLTNPHCNPCAKMHTRIENLLLQNPGFGIQYIFSSFNEELESSTCFLTAIYLNEGKEKAQRIFSEWYESGKLQKEEFFRKYHTDLDNPAVEIECAKYKRWRQQTRIGATPTILVNGYKLPDQYKIEDLKYFMNVEC